MAQPHFIVFANEKGGTGKSTTAVHTAVALAASGHRVAALDLDSRQRTLTRYLENRAATIRRLEVDLPNAAFEVLEDQGEAGLEEGARGGVQRPPAAGADDGLHRIRHPSTAIAARVNPSRRMQSLSSSPRARLRTSRCSAVGAPMATVRVMSVVPSRNCAPESTRYSMPGASGRLVASVER